jgi:hypothetical protein
MTGGRARDVVDGREPLVDGVAVVGGVELERLVAAVKCVRDVPVGDLEELPP